MGRPIWACIFGLKMRIGSGDLRRKKLHVPKGIRTRPSSARLKKSLFDVLATFVKEATVLDLYAGAGSLGFEALSRGAKQVLFVEKERNAVQAIQKNLSELAISERGLIWKRDVFIALDKLIKEDVRFDIVFADPPYAERQLPRVLMNLGRNNNVVVEEGLVVVEHHHKTLLKNQYGSLSTYRVLKSGESCFTLYRSVC